MYLAYRWIMYVEKNIYDVDGKLVIHHENLKRLKRRLEIIRHVHTAPHVYAAILVEIYRRRNFKEEFMNVSTHYFFPVLDTGLSLERMSTA